MPEKFDLDKAIRKVPDFPKQGILFYDITSVLMNPKAFNYCIEKMDELFGTAPVNAVVGIESRGFIFAATYAHKKGLPLILIRKKGKLPGPTYSQSFTLEYGQDTIEVHKADLSADMNVLLVDDLIATGGTLKAAGSLLAQGGAKIHAIFSVIGLPFLKYDAVLKDYRVETLIDYDSE